MRRLKNYVLFFIIIGCITPLFAQEENSGGTTINIPIILSYQTSFDESISIFNGTGVSLDSISQTIKDLEKIALRADLSILVNVLFDLGGVISIGPEVGVRAPIISYILPLIDSQGASALGNSSMLHVPIRAVVDFELIPGFHLGLFVGTAMNFWLNDNVGDLTLDIGLRANIFNILLVEAIYVPPFTIGKMGEPLPDLSLDNYWQNTLTFGVGISPFIEL